MDESTIKSNIETLRKAGHLSQLEMAERLGIDRNTYRGIEKGRTRVLNACLERIAEILGVSLFRLVAGCDLEEGDLHDLTDIRAEYGGKVRDQQAQYEARIQDLQEALRRKEEEIARLNAWLADKEQIISFLKNRRETAENG